MVMLKRTFLIGSVLGATAASAAWSVSWLGLVHESAMPSTMRRIGVVDGCVFWLGWESSDWDEHGSPIKLGGGGSPSVEWLLGPDAASVASHAHNPWTPTWLHMTSPPVLMISVPLYAFVVLFSIAPVWCLRRSLRAARRAGMGCCLNCGYDLRRNVSGICPECGTSVSGSSVQSD